MSQLPRAGGNYHNYLRNTVPHRARIRDFAEIPEVRLALALVLLLPADVLQLLVQVAQLLRQLGDMRTVVLAVRLGVADDDVKVEADVCVRPPGGA